MSEDTPSPGRRPHGRGYPDRTSADPPSSASTDPPSSTSSEPFSLGGSFPAAGRAPISVRDAVDDQETAGTLHTAPRLWQGTGDVIEDAGVWVREGKVLWSGPLSELPPDNGSSTDGSGPATNPPPRRVDHPGCTILPGLIETHAHLSHGSPPLVSATLATERHQVPWDALSSLHTARVLASQGVTTVQSLGARHFTDVTLREAVRAGVVRGPRIVASGPQVTTTGGHSWRNGGEVDSLDDIRHRVREFHTWGVDAVKVMATGGFMTEGSAPWNAQFTTDELRVLVEEAHRLGKHTAAHAHGTQGIRRSVEAGIDYVAHASFVGEDGATRFDPLLADEMARRGTFADICAVPTFPPVEGEHFGARARELWEHGVGIVLGTDIGAVLPPEAYLWTLEELVAGGLPIREVLVAATSRAAAAAGLAGVTGALLPGYDADVLVVRGDPTRDVSDLRNTQLVLIGGEEFARDPVAHYVPPARLGGPPARVVSALRGRTERALRHPLG